MRLVFRLSPRGLEYGLFTADGDSVHESHIKLDAYTPANLRRAFHHDVVTQLRAHGRLVSKIGIVVPIADQSSGAATLASGDRPFVVKNDSLLASVIEPITILAAACKATWPHVNRVWLWDTYLSSKLARGAVVPPFSPDSVKQFRLSPQVLESFAHEGNRRLAKHDVMASVVCGDSTSIIVFDGEDIVAAHPMYSLWSSVMGFWFGGAVDLGAVSRMRDMTRTDRWASGIRQNYGFQAMIGVDYDFDTLLSLAGIGRRRADIPDVPIETAEAISLAINAFARSVTSALAGLLASRDGVREIVVTSPYTTHSSPFWPLVFKPWQSTPITWNPHSSLASAARHLI